jgi:hypothetical protein
MNHIIKRKYDCAQPVMPPPMIRSEYLFFKLLGSLILLAAMSRGLFELVFDKTTAYVVQLILFFSWIFLAKMREWFVVSIRFPMEAKLIFISLIIALISSICTLMISGFWGSFFYFGIFAVICVLLYSGILFSVGCNGVVVATNVAITVIGLVLIGILQQFGYLGDLPGYSWAYGGAIRPPSLTGSMLHYPIIVSVLALILIDIGLRFNKKWSLVLGALSMFSILTTFSRSGMVIIIGALAYVVLRIRRDLVMPLILIFFVFIIGLFVLNEIIPEIAGNYIDRVVNIGSMEDEGNLGRVDSWSAAISSVLHGPVLVSAETGFHTNATINFGLTNAGITSESSLLLLALNFGVLTALLIYSAMFLFGIDSGLSVVTRGGVIGVMIQSLFYQSLEVLPFVFSVALLISSGRLNYGIRGYIKSR